ncbi:hypothetical protein GYB22_12565 [bacterium]|nr:hypothetical protein [bacterium]
MRLVTTTLLLLLINAVWADRCHSIKSGNWYSVLSCTSNSNRVIQIEYGDTVYVNSSITTPVDTLVINGVLDIANGRKISMSSGGIIIVSTSGEITGGNGGTKFDFPGSSSDLSGPFNVTGPVYADSSTQGAFTGSLPVNWLNVDAKITDGLVQVEWSTAYEINNNYYQIELSWDAVNFKTYNELNAAEGDQHAITSYTTQFKVNEIAGPIAYLRIKQVDFDGKFSYSKIVVVKLQNQIQYSLNQGILTVHGIPSGTGFSVIDLQGKELATSGSDSTLDLRPFKDQLVILKFEEPTITRNIKLVIH